MTDVNLDYSGNGNTFAQDYSNNIVPTVFTFTGIEVRNNYVNNMSVPVELGVAGSPYYLATLIDDNNFADAAWTAYAGPVVTANLGLTEGWHEMWIGLRGHGDDPTNAVWQWARLKLDFNPAALAITGPTNTTVGMPVIQLTGYSPEALQSISYDLSNAAGVFTNQQVLVEGQDYSTNTFEFTTNYFQAFDVPLTNGPNVITLHATDWAGNLITLVTNFTLDYSAKTTAPLVQLLWPQEGMEICESNIVCRGQVNDPTATVTVQLVDADGTTNTAGSLVRRDGVFYTDNLVLADGTNYLNYTVTDAAGNVATTNIMVSTSDLGLTLNPVVAGQSLVTGTIATNGYTIWVNGVEATNNGDGTWSATITPIGVAGGAVVVNAVAGGDPSLQQIVEPPQGVFISSYHASYHLDSTWEVPLFSHGEWTQLDWQDGGGGTANDGDDGQLLNIYSWPASQWPEPLPEGMGQSWLFTSQTNGYWETNVVGGPGLKEEHCSIGWASDQQQGSRTADTEVKLATGGPPGSSQKSLWCITASATAYTNQNDTTGIPVPPEQISIGGLGNLDTNGQLWVVLPDNDPSVVTPKTSRNNYSFSVGGQKYTLNHFDFACSPPLDINRTTIGIGETVELNGMPEDTVWSVTGGGSVSPADGSSTAFHAGFSPTTSTVHAQYKGTELTQDFTVIAPSSISIISNWDNPFYATDNPDGTLMAARTRYQCIILPMNVDFSHVTFRENVSPDIIHWPNGLVQTNMPDIGFGGIDCSHSDPDTIVGSAPRAYIFNGTNFVDFSYSSTWTDQYESDSGWVDFSTRTATRSFRGSDRQA